MNITGWILQGALGASEPTLPLRATAAAERLRRALADLSVRFTRALQPTAELVGQGLHLSDEAVQLFSEEVSSLSLAVHSGFTACLHGVRSIEMTPWRSSISQSPKSIERRNMVHLQTVTPLAAELLGMRLHYM